MENEIAEDSLQNEKNNKESSVWQLIKLRLTMINNTFLLYLYNNLLILKQKHISFITLFML